ncbi:MAG: tetratricopeptide repeat protein [Candidatus Latescibacteria bacterium]|nr:tetratricopeptide repeat protein [Candidatus Latescibacterota bacterium]
MPMIAYVVLALGLALRAGAEPANLVQLAEAAEALANQGRLTEAIAAYEQAMAAGAGSARVLNRLAGLYLQTEQLEKGTLLLRRSLQENPEQAQVCFELAKVFQVTDQPDSAMRYARQAQTLEPQSSAIVTLIGAVHLQAEHPAEAKQAFAQALELDARNPEAHRFLGVYYTERDSLAEAIAEFRQVTRILPDDLEANNNIAFLLARQKQYPEALAAYKKAEMLAQDPRMRQAVRANREAVEAVMAGKMRARFILVDTQARAAEVVAKLKAGEDFAALAARFSKAPNAQVGGDTGFVGPGALMDGFEKAVLGLKTGQTSEPLTLPMGVVIIQRLN